LTNNAKIVNFAGLHLKFGLLACGATIVSKCKALGTTLRSEENVHHVWWDQDE
jgi:hypothetical protein